MSYFWLPCEGGEGSAREGGGGGAPLGIVGFAILFGGSELVGEGDFIGGRFIDELLRLCVGLLLRVGGGGALPLTLPLLGPLGRFPKLGGPGGRSFLKFGLFPPGGGWGGPGLLLLGCGWGGNRLLVEGPLFCDGNLKPV